MLSTRVAYDDRRRRRRRGRFVFGLSAAVLLALIAVFAAPIATRRLRERRRRQSLEREVQDLVHAINMSIPMKVEIYRMLDSMDAAELEEMRKVYESMMKESDNRDPVLDEKVNEILGDFEEPAGLGAAEQAFLAVAGAVLLLSVAYLGFTEAVRAAVWGRRTTALKKALEDGGTDGPVLEAAVRDGLRAADELSARVGDLEHPLSEHDVWPPPGADARRHFESILARAPRPSQWHAALYRLAKLTRFHAWA